MIDFPRSVRIRTGTARLLMPAMLALAMLGHATAASPMMTEIRSLGTVSNEQIFELTVGSYEVETFIRQGVDYQRVRIPNASLVGEPGEPEMPVMGTLIGLSSLSNPSIRVIAADYETKYGLRLVPATGVTTAAGAFTVAEMSAPEEVLIPESDIYATAAFFPGPLAEIGEAGYMREQAVAGLRFFPVQFNPVSGQIRVYSRIVVGVSTDETAAETAAAASATDRRPEHPTVEKVLSRTLLNYNLPARPYEAARLLPSKHEVSSSAHATVDKERLKLYVEVDGIHALSYGDLKEAGFDPDAVDPRKLRLLNRGKELPILLLGAEDGRFDESDRLLWYGAKLDDPYSLANVYWLEEGETSGQRMAERYVAPGDAVAATSFPWTVHAEENDAYWQTMPNGEGRDHYFWGGLISPNTEGLPTSSTFTVTLNHTDPVAADANVRVRLKGYTALSHRTQIRLNGTVVDDQVWEGQAIFDHDVEIAQGLLVEGDNAITVQTLSSGASADQVLVDWLEIDYVKTYVAERDRLQFGAPTAGTFQFAPTGFDSDEILLFDITSPTNPVHLNGGQIQLDGVQFRIRFDDTAKEGSQYVALTETAYLSPAARVLDRPSTWRSPSQGADYIIITHGLFDQAAEQLAAHRRDQGLRVATVDVQDLYDEFNDGLFNPGAIRDFLIYAYEHWLSPAPAYVVLMGDSAIDFKDNRRSGTTSYVPTQIVDTPLLGQTASDQWFTRIRGDDALPDIFLGRLSVESAAEAAGVVAKLINYDLMPPDDTWNHRLAMIADDGSPAFPGLSEALISRSPHYYEAVRVDVEDYPPGNPTTDIQDAFDGGAVLMNYTGHGGTQNWGVWQDNGFFGVANIPDLGRSNRLPFVTVANCLSGFFAGSSSFVSVAEALQRTPEKGAIAVFAPTDLGYASGHRILMEELYDAIFQDDLVNVGAATAAAQMAAIGRSPIWTEMVETYVLLGDPITRLGIPANYPYVISTSPADGETGVAMDRPVRIRFSKPVDPGAVSLSSAASEALTWNDAFTVATYSDPDLEHGQMYEFIVDVRDRLGNTLGDGKAPNRWRFVISRDNQPPSVLVGSRSGAEDTVSDGDSFSLAFDESVRPSSLDIAIEPAVTGEFYWQAENSFAVFVPEKAFTPGQRYTITVESVTDLAGNRLAKPVARRLFFGDGEHQIFLPAVAVK